MGEATESERQEVERIMRKAEALGEDPLRVASALGHSEREPTSLQAVEDVEPRSRLRRLLARRPPRSRSRF
jgi:hypothetical protein